MKVAILGFGREGQSLLKFLKKSAQYKNAEFWIVDKKATIKIPPGVHGELGKNYLKNLGRFDVVFRSPGIPYNLPELKKALHAGVTFSSATKLFFEKCPAKVIGVTGSKGKSTTSTLVYKMLKAAERKAILAGNIGASPLDALKKIDEKTWAVLELSSFQLQDLERSPRIAVLLDVFPEHQDAHGSLEEYYEAKANISRFQQSGDKVFFFADNGKSRALAQYGQGGKVSVDAKHFKLFKPDDLKIPGLHNFRNAVMAASVARSLGVPSNAIIRVIRNFRGLKHRLELVRTVTIPTPVPPAPRPRTRGANKIYSSILENLRIDFYNDSASTNPHASAAAIKSFPNEPKILIAGGQDKNLDYKPLAEALKSASWRTNTKLVVLFGENKAKVRRQIAHGKVQIVACNNLSTAVQTAYKKSRQLVASSHLPVAILFSPGAASFDQFKNYADRGKQFKKLVGRLTERHSHILKNVRMS